MAATQVSGIHSKLASRAGSVSIRWKQLGAFLCVGVLTLAVGLFGMSKLNQSHRSTQKIESGAYEPLRHADSLRAHYDAATLASIVKSWIPSTATQEQAAMATELKGGTGELQTLAKLDLPDATHRQVQTLQKSWTDFQNLTGSNVDYAHASAAEQARIAKIAQDVGVQVNKLIDMITKDARAIQHDAASSHASAVQVTWVVIAIALLAAIALGWFLGRSLVKPLQRTVSVLRKVAKGDFTQRLEVRSGDELGQMAEAVNETIDRTSEVLLSIETSARVLADSSESFATKSDDMATAAEAAAAHAGSASDTIGAMSANIQAVAAATEQMASSIREIAQSSSEAATVATDAVQETANTTATVARLGESSAEIGAVLELINSIAEQTNLLALNATIEAARAGEAGKGFAVVANEVKELAQETSKATEDIARRVEVIQSDTREAVQAIDRISEVIDRINEFQTTIAGAVEEQSATTSEIARTVHQVESGSSEIGENVATLTSMAGRTTTVAEDNRSGAAQLASMADDLSRLIASFTISPSPKS
jgi:methyl-accepting chemotaxis protein